MKPGDLVRLEKKLGKECGRLVISSTPDGRWGKEVGTMGNDEVGVVLEEVVNQHGNTTVKLMSSGGIVGWMPQEWLRVE